MLGDGTVLQNLYGVRVAKVAATIRKPPDLAPAHALGPFNYTAVLSAILR